MKITVARDPLVTVLQAVSRAVSTRTAIQALAGVMLEVGEGRTTFKATDREIGIEMGLDADGEGSGALVLPGRLLADVVRSLPDEQVTIESQDGRAATITAGHAHFELRGLAAEDFPQLPTPSEQPITLPAPPLLETIDRVARAASRDEARPILTGIHVTAADRELTMVATDSYRLAVKTTTLEEPVDEQIDATIPARALREISRLATQTEAERVQLSLLGNQAVLVVGEAQLSSRLIEGQFPNHRQLLPDAFEHEVRLSRQELLEIVRRVSLMAQKNAPLRLIFSRGELNVAAATPDVGEAREALPAAFEADELEIGFNPDFLREGIESVEAEDIVLKLISPLRPGLLQAAGDEEYRYLVMPIRLNN